ncbi:MAG: ATP-binding protein, partial [Chloroflexi bacterium]|nr:ATP-binding protein [Chloroflexota bacterium]
MLNTKGKFYLGRILDHDKPLLYDPDDLTTHAVVVGMTGSGKTGLCIDIMEEAALQNTPALLIDPKGDITNALLHFPDLLPTDFQPWINPDEARRAGKTVEASATETAATWKKGLAEWGIGSERMRALKNAAQFAVFTPGSDAGIPVSILASLKAPELDWKENTELLREKISGTVTAILGLVGMSDIDPVRSREHILLSNIFENAWSQGKDLDLSELILQTQNPPFDKLGVFDVSTFFPDKDRFELAMLLNNILASPSFQSWIEGQPLDINSLLYMPNGRPRHSVFYIAHLSNEERMFFVTLLYSAVETWMRAQSGTTGLRALLYFDEIFGYMPPVSNPPSKQLMLRMLKQGRAFGVGQVLVTQNPADLDYKALSNAGSWFVGKLQTENDKNRLLDGLEGAAPGLDRRHYDDLISTLDKRVFLLHNIHEKEPQLFTTRWAMNYLAGPVTRNQIPALNKLAGVSAPKQEARAAVAGATVSQTSSTSSEELPGSSSRPAVHSGIDEYFLP